MLQTMSGKSSPSKRQAGPTVFVVDDDEGVRDSLRFLLKSVGLATKSLGSAAEFLASYDVNQPGCLVLDVRMPAMSGLELQQQLNIRGAMIPVIFITGHGDIRWQWRRCNMEHSIFYRNPFATRISSIGFKRHSRRTRTIAQV